VAGDRAQRQERPVCRVAAAAGQLGSQLGGQVALRLPTAHRGSGELLTHPAAGDELYSQRGLEVAQIPGGAQRPIHGGEWADDAPVSFGCWTAAALGATLALRTHATNGSHSAFGMETPLDSPACSSRVRATGSRLTAPGPPATWAWPWLWTTPPRRRGGPSRRPAVEADRVDLMTRRWLTIRVELLHGRGEVFDPPPGRNFVVPRAPRSTTSGKRSTLPWPGGTCPT